MADMHTEGGAEGREVKVGKQRDSHPRQPENHLQVSLSDVSQEMKRKFP